MGGAGLALGTHKKRRLTPLGGGLIVSYMENEIKVGSVVFYFNASSNIFRGPGTVTAIQFDEKIGVDIFTVLWQSAGETWDHYRSGLLTLAQKEAANG